MTNKTNIATLIASPKKHVHDNGLVETHSQFKQNFGIQPEGGFSQSKEFVGGLDASLRSMGIELICPRLGSQEPQPEFDCLVLKTKK